MKVVVRRTSVALTLTSPSFTILRSRSGYLYSYFFLYKKRPIYIFVLCPPFQGSTIITKLLDSSEFTSSFIDTSDWAGEGQKFINDPLYEENKWIKTRILN